MHALKTISQETLLLALTEYYEKYRKIIELGGDEDEFTTCKFSLEAILNELNIRRSQAEPLFNTEAEPEREDFNFNRIDS